MSEKATPGPWHAYDRGIGWEVHFGPEPADGLHWHPREPTADDRRAGIGCEGLSDGFRDTMNEANARLVAAAPTLYAIVKQWVDGRGDLHPVFGEARKLLDQIEGVAHG